MKRIAAYICILLSVTACGDSEKLPPLPKPVDLVMEVDGDNLVMGDDMTLCIRTKDTAKSVNEDVTIKLYAKEEGEDASGVFENFPSAVEIRKGESALTVVLPVKRSGLVGMHDVEISAFSRGYRIAGTPVSVRISDFHRINVSVKGNRDGIVAEGESFILSADAGVQLSEDVTIEVRCPDHEEFLSGLPESITIKSGCTCADSGPIQMLSDGGYYQDVSVRLEFESSSETVPMGNETLLISRADSDEPLGTLLADERHLYPEPSKAFVSSSNIHDVEEWGGQDFTEVIPDVTAHPSLAGWKFHNAVEFHYIQSMLYNNYVLGVQHSSGGQDRPHSFWDQTTAKAGQHMTVNNDRYSAITEGGYMRMWAAKDGTQPKGYGVAALYSNKFKDPSGNNSNTAKPMYCHILPGMRLEFRMRVRGELYGFNPAIWLMGNSNIQPSGAVGWPACGEVDVVEIPVGPVTGNGPWQTCHFGNASQDGKDVYAPSTSRLSGVDPSEWNIYWMEWTDGNTMRLGINGQTNLCVTRSDAVSNGAVWPFDLQANPYGLHLILSLGYPAPSTWALGYTGTPPAGWDEGFSSVSYPASRTDERTPRMEIDWIRYYISEEYPENLPTPYNNVKFY